MLALRTYVYVDGLNLYYGAVRDTRFKWLDLSSLCRTLLPRDQIVKIKYYTAIVDARPDDPDAPTRQQFYLRALRTIPSVSIHYGHFLTQERWLLLVKPRGRTKKARVYRTEEKGSDVNLATHLVRDAFKQEFDAAVVITNDSDLLEPIRIVRYELGLPVGILNPQARPSKALLPLVTFLKQIRPGHLSRSQFADVLRDKDGVFRKPSAW